jgi:hypothetical protein
MAHKGFLVIADISGYTAFLTQGELEHAQDILKSLTHTLLDKTQAPLVVAKLEGDAVFSYAPERSFALGQTLLEALENMYYAFTSARERMKANTTCTCTACTLIPSLDLKIALHYGEYLIEKIGQGMELSGPDVIAVHRLLKNTIIEKTGIEAYLFITEKAAQAMTLGDITDSMIRHTDTYEHIGELAGYVHDLKPVWRRLNAERRITIPEKEIWVQESADIPAPAQVVWEYIHEPSRRTKMLAVLGVEIEKPQNGRVGVGSGMHCDHGNAKTRFHIKEWRPFESAAYDVSPVADASFMNTISIEPLDSGSRVVITYGFPAGKSMSGRLAALTMRQTMKKGFADGARDNLRRLSETITEDIQSGALVMASAAAPEGA